MLARRSALCLFATVTLAFVASFSQAAPVNVQGVSSNIHLAKRAVPASAIEGALVKREIIGIIGCRSPKDCLDEHYSPTKRRAEGEISHNTQCFDPEHPYSCHHIVKGKGETMDDDSKLDERSSSETISKRDAPGLFDKHTAMMEEKLSTRAAEVDSLDSSQLHPWGKSKPIHTRAASTSDIVVVDPISKRDANKKTSPGKLWPWHNIIHSRSSPKGTIAQHGSLAERSDGEITTQRLKDWHGMNGIRSIAGDSDTTREGSLAARKDSDVTTQRLKDWNGMDARRSISGEDMTSEDGLAARSDDSSSLKQRLHDWRHKGHM